MRPPPREDSLQTVEFCRVLLVGGTQADRDGLAQMLASFVNRYQFGWESSLGEERDHLQGEAPHVILWDDGCGGSISSFVEDARSDGCSAPIVALLSHHVDESTVVRSGAIDALRKGEYDAAMLDRTIRYALERQRLITELDQERQLLHALLDNLPAAIYFKDLDSRFLRVSRKLADAFGLDDPSLAIGKADADFFAEEHARRALEDERSLIRGDAQVIRKEEKEVWPDGRVSWAATSKLPLRDRRERVVGTFGVSRDVTDKKAAEASLRLAKEHAEAASRAKSEFVANMSHEFRSPLNVIMGMADIVLETSLDDHQREYIEMVRDSSETLLAIVNDVLDFSKIEAGKMELSPTLIDVRLVCRQTLAPLVVRAENKGVRFGVAIDPTIPQRLMIDGVRWRQVITNLASNAIKFTDDGEVEFGLDLVSDMEDEVVIRVSVRDTGIGIPPAKLVEIFGAFEQADSSTTRRFGGTGLGLSISSRIVNLMGGVLEVESVENAGSTFHFEIVAKRGYADGIPPVPGNSSEWDLDVLADRLRDLTVLVVNDSAAGRKVIEAHLDRMGIGHRSVADGIEAIDCVGSQDIDLVLMDVQMPVMDGLEATRILRERELGSAVRVPIVAVTARAMESDRLSCVAAGMDGYVAVPFTSAELLTAMAVAAGRMVKTG